MLGQPDSHHAAHKTMAKSVVGHTITSANVNCMNPTPQSDSQQTCPKCRDGQPVPPIPFDDPNALVRAEQVAAHFQTTTGSLGYQRYAGTGPRFVKIGRRVMYRVADLITYIDTHAVDPADKRRSA